MKILFYFIVIIVGYIMGCIQSSYIIGRMNKIDIREHGSKNAGASNAFMTLGWKKGVLVGVIDILKAAIPVFIVTLVFPGNDILAMACGASVVLGHIFPVFMGFRGGKGTASIVGTMMGLNPILLVIGGLVIILVTIISDYIAIGTFFMLISLLICLIIFDYSLVAILIFIGIVLLILCLHLPNFKRIRGGNETSFKSAFKKKYE